MTNLKHLSSDPKIRSIFQKHLNALARDIGRELTQPLLAHWGLTAEDLGLTAETVPLPTPPSTEPLAPLALIYDPQARRWTCPRCRAFSDPRRRSVTAHLRFCRADVSPYQAARKPRKTTKKKP